MLSCSSIRNCIPKYEIGIYLDIRMAWFIASFMKSLAKWIAISSGVHHDIAVSSWQACAFGGICVALKVPSATRGSARGWMAWGILWCISRFPAQKHVTTCADPLHICMTIGGDCDLAIAISRSKLTRAAPLGIPPGTLRFDLRALHITAYARIL